MKVRARTRRPRYGSATPTGAWLSALLALLPLSGLFWAIGATGMGIA